MDMEEQEEEEEEEKGLWEGREEGQPVSTTDR